MIMNRRLIVNNCVIVYALIAATFTGGCIKNQPQQEVHHFEVDELDAVLAIIIDLSGSFAGSWDDKAYPLFLNLMDRFFTGAAGSESRVIIGQLSGNDDVLLFQGTPSELRTRFQSPEELNAYLSEHSNPRSSPVFKATRRAVDYVASMPDVTNNTRSLVVVLSDLVDSETNPQSRTNSGHAMVEALQRYRAKGGGLAFYYVDQNEEDRWHRIMTKSGYTPGTYVIENEIVENPTLPSFE